MAPKKNTETVASPEFKYFGIDGRGRRIETAQSGNSTIIRLPYCDYVSEPLSPKRAAKALDYCVTNTQTFIDTTLI